MLSVNLGSAGKYGKRQQHGAEDPQICCNEKQGFGRQFYFTTECIVCGLYLPIYAVARD